MTVSRPSSLIFVSLLILVISANAYAGGRPDGQSRSWFGQVNTGYEFTTGSTRDFLHANWALGGGALYWPSDWPLGIALDLNYSRFDFTSSTIRAINDAIADDPMNEGEITGGNVENWQFGLNGIWSLGDDTGSGFYLKGGVSWNSITGRLTDTGLVYYPPICDPWFWWCTPGGIGPGTIVVGKQSSDEFGWNVGIGYSVRNLSGQLYFELGYEQIQFDNTDIEYIPFNIGYRW